MNRIQPTARWGGANITRVPLPTESRSEIVKHALHQVGVVQDQRVGHSNAIIQLEVIVMKR